MAGRQATRAPVPVTMLSGFLGSGKTTLLRNLLQQNEQRIACIVNDVASINIDAKLIRNDRSNANKQTYTSTKDLAETVELENGCACCSIQDELFMSFESLLAVADRKGIQYDRFVLENSGVAEPQNLREAFNEAILDGHPVMSRIYLDNMVTIVDSGTFIMDYSSCTALAARPDLGEGGTLRPVVDLLVEQIECADFVLLNKKDTITEEQGVSLTDIVKQLNPIAKVETCEHGKVDIQKVFSSESRGLIAQLNTEGQHRSAVTAARKAAAALEHKDKHDHHHHEHKDEKHEHKEHDHQHEHKEHDHQHEEHAQKHHGDHHHKEHAHGHGDHEHGHDHDHSHDHDHHGHSHTHERQSTTAAKRFGIFSFVYSRRRPFHPQRLRELVLKWLPVANNAALEGTAQGEGESPIKAVLRSKGFMWMSYSHSSAFYWSHAGQHFDIRDEGDWWAIVPESDWPTDLGQRRVILSDFDYDSDFGDRRQEIVFIGAGMDEKAICEKLDAALLTDEEMEAYKQRYAGAKDPEHPDVVMEKKKRQKLHA